MIIDFSTSIFIFLLLITGLLSWLILYFKNFKKNEIKKIHKILIQIEKEHQIEIQLAKASKEILVLENQTHQKFINIRVTICNIDYTLHEIL